MAQDGTKGIFHVCSECDMVKVEHHLLGEFLLFGLYASRSVMWRGYLCNQGLKDIHTYPNFSILL